jgi:ABC-type lipoprotein export system ATPase subunit
MIRAESLTKEYRDGRSSLKAVNEAAFTIKPGEFVLVVGRSGSGKSTLLSMMGGITRPSSGKVYVDEKDIWSFNDKQLSELRALTMGFVFQFAGLLPTLTAQENAVLPSLFRKGEYDVHARTEELFRSFGIEDKINSYPSQLSGGEMKRVSIARALMNDPAILLADEPTGDLDVDTERDIMEIFSGVNKKGKTIVMVTHNPDLSTYADRLFRMEKGVITEVPTTKALDQQRR